MKFFIRTERVEHEDACLFLKGKAAADTRAMVLVLPLLRKNARASIADFAKSANLAEADVAARIAAAGAKANSS